MDALGLPIAFKTFIVGSMDIFPRRQQKYMVIFMGNAGVLKMLTISLSKTVHIGRYVRNAPIKKGNWAIQGIGRPELLDPSLQYPFAEQ